VISANAELDLKALAAASGDRMKPCLPNREGGWDTHFRLAT
jgi:hypothetical protein